MSEIVSLLNPKRVSAVGLDAGGSWSLAFGRYEGIKVNAVVAGSCWLSMEGSDAPLRVSAGDCFLLMRGRPFRLASDVDACPVDAEGVIKGAQGGGTAVVNGGGDFFLFGSRFTLDDEHARFLLGSLPPLLHIPAASGDGTLAWALERLRAELHAERPGGNLAVHHLAHLMLVDVLRRYATDGTRSGGWLGALSDRKIGRALTLMHGDPSRRWTLSDLAGEIAMSRTSFAVRFKRCVGVAPLDYLTRWRMLLAGERLATSATSIAALAPSLGYESESAFGAAFKRVMGCSPRTYARSRAAAAPESQSPAGGLVRR
nr:AraC family transcriptional regulator [Azospirillum oleiclasticum]